MLYWASDAEVAELADAQDLGSCGREAVGVQLPPSAPPVSLSMIAWDPAGMASRPQRSLLIIHFYQV
jgi:hypothetical protein